MIMLLKIHPENPSRRQILKVCEILRKGGIIVYPTDSVYALGCDIYNHKAIEQVARLKGIRPEKADFSFIFSDLRQVSDYARLFDNRLFKLMKSHLPGPYTFILHARNNVPKIFQSRKKTIGIRIPDNKIPVELVRSLGNPIMTTSIHDEDTLLEYTTDPDLIYEKYKDKVAVVISGGVGKNVPTTVVDCTQPEPVIVRQGIGLIE
jgi:tRNA threonylcarbamoyl adenosine modification protein (Sua5/YciO/YrdC/YwlC family)